MTDGKEQLDEQIEYAAMSDEIYETVIGQLNLPEGDELFAAQVLKTLKTSLKKHLSTLIFVNLNDDQKDHFKTYAVGVDEVVSLDDTLIDFASHYPDLTEKMNAAVNPFFDEFVERFNRIANA